MPVSMIRHKVRNYAQWKPIYDQHRSVRRSSGCVSEQLYAEATDPNLLTVILEWDDLEKARKFGQSEDLKKTMQNAGVVGQPEITFLEPIEKHALGGAEGELERIAAVIPQGFNTRDFNLTRSVLADQVEWLDVP